MSNKWRNVFFIFGVLAIIIMVFTFDVNWSDILSMLKKARLWFPCILLLWLIIYIINTCSWSLIIRDEDTPKVPFLHLFKITISGFALNYTTPFGLLGGEPYKIMELSEIVGTKKATSSVLLFLMMHISSHFCFWFSSVVLYLVLSLSKIERYPLNIWILISLVVCAIFFLFVINLFFRGYKHGFVVKVFGLLKKIPFVKKWAVSFELSHTDQLIQIDEQISNLHGQRKKRFWTSLFLEYVARFVSCVEYYWLLKIMMPTVTYWDSVLIMAFSSLFSNMLFFSPMQLGAREGGLAMASGGLSIPSSFGLFTALITRLREMFWIIVGIALMKVNPGK